MSTYTPEQQREQEQVTGVITGIVQKGPDKWQAVVLPDGSQYNKNLWTKDVTVVQYLTSQIGNRLAFLCNASHWTRQDGQPVRSLWIDQVGSPTVGSPALAGPPVATPQQPWNAAQAAQQAGQIVHAQPVATPMAQAPQQDLREAKIHRQTASKVAAQLLGYLDKDEQNLATLLSLSDRLVAYYDNGSTQAESLDDLMQRAMPASMEEPPPLDDDSIPF